MASTLFSLLVCEIGLRLLTRYGRPGVRAGVLDYVAQLSTATGTDRKWFTEDPPPLPNRSPVSSERLARYRDYERRGLFAPEADYVWNRYFLESQRCAEPNALDRYPGALAVFDPPVVSPYPRYRFPPNITTAGGLVTNEFGLRGRPLSLAKPPGTIRIAFLGASTTVGFHQFPFSYPDRVVHWLNRFAETNGYSVRFEALNGGRYGLNSQDIARILKDELLPLAPDLAIYYEGSNQFAAATELVSPRVPPRQRIDPMNPVVHHKVPEFLRTHLALADLADRALRGFHGGAEPRKPAYRLVWPAGVNERNPDADQPNLPLRLPTIVKDLDSIRNALGSVGARLVLCSFEWLAEDGLTLSPARHQYIYEHLNTALWPLRYGDIRRLADFQNRVFRRWARARGADFLNVASVIPQNPDLFIDAIHMTEAGERLRAWITFQLLVPLIRRELQSGRLPLPGGPQRLPAPPSLAISQAASRCGDAPFASLVRIDEATSLPTLAIGYDDAQVHYGRPVEIVTADLPDSHAAVLPIYIPPRVPGPHYVFLRGRVLAGQIGVGLRETLDGKHTDPKYTKTLSPSLGAVSAYLPVFAPERTDALVIANAAPGRVRSRILIEDAALLAPSQPLATRVIQSIDLERFTLADPKASLERGKSGVVATTKAERYSYAARAPLGLSASAGPDLSVHVRARALEGNPGFGVLSPDGQTFLVQRSVWPTDGPEEIVLPLPAPPMTGDLIITNCAIGAIPSKVIVERIEIRKAP